MQIKRRRPKYKPEKEQAKRTRTNNQIRVDEVRLIDEDDQNIGVISFKEALSQAEEIGLDLVEVNPKAVPPVCKIMNFGKYKYDQEKVAHKQKMASKKTEVKGIRLSFKIKGADLETRVNQATKFLEAGHQVKVEMILKGREKAHSPQAREVMQNFVSMVEGDVKIIQPVQKQGGRFSVIFALKS
jgi:translation initiation factor IF-3